MKTKLTGIEIFNERATDYQVKFMDVGAYSKSLDYMLDLLTNVNPAILDIACGPGNIAQYILNKKPNVQITGCDISPNMIELAKINNPKAQFFVINSKEIAKIEIKFDAIVCSFLLPYLSKEEFAEILIKIYNLLNPNGVLYLSTMEDDYAKSGITTNSKGDELFTYYYESEFLKEKLIENNFAILNLERLNNMNGNKKVTDLIIIAQK